MGLKIGRGLELPLDAVTQTFALLAKRGGGKTYGALKLAEEMLEENVQIVAVDPVGKWWSLRLAADGKSPGFEIPVFGGHNGDLPLEPGAGRLIADLVVDRGVSAVLDVSLMRKGERKHFVTDFAEQLLLRKKRERAPAPLHLFLEESQVFVPQRTQRGEERMLGAFEDLVKLGRNYGIGATLISQRPQAVNKDVLTQTECLLVLQTIGAQERKALREWMREVGSDRSDAIDELPSLQQGQAYLWSPGWLREFRKVRIGRRRTFDASATPKVGARGKAAAPRKLDDAELEQLRETMADVVQKAEENDPKALRRELAKAKREMAELAKRASSGDLVDEAALEAARQDGIAAGRAAGDRAVAEWARRTAEVEAALARMIADGEKARDVMAEALDVELPKTVANPRAVMRKASGSRATVPRVPVPSDGGDAPHLGKGERAVLIAIAQHDAGVDRTQLSLLAGYKKSTRDLYVRTLAAAGLVVVDGGTIRATEAGVAALGSEYEPLPVGAELRRHWLERLPQGEARVLQCAIDAYPRSVGREEVSELTSLMKSTRDLYIRKLQARHLLVAGRGDIKAADELF